MRADRLVATLLLLQARGTVTAREVAEELEVSERTARRDLDALSVAGIPVYSKQGRGGGWELIGGATTDLTGLRSVEARALLTMAAATGHATPEFTSAMRKLTQALPAPIRVETEQVMASVVADNSSWGNRAASMRPEPRRDEWLEPLQRAVIEQSTVVLTYDTPRKGESERDIDPLGLVTKQGLWYVLAVTEAGQRSFRLDRIIDVVVTERHFDRPADFVLGEAWEEITTGYLDRSTRTATSAIVRNDILPALAALGVETVVRDTVVGDTVAGGTVVGGPVAGGTDRSRVTLAAWNVDVLAAEIAGVMYAIELIDPPQGLVDRLAAIGAELVSRFAPATER